MKESIGWVATAAFAASYLCKNPRALRRVQALAACLWVFYGFLVGALPVVVANLVVATMAVVYPWVRDRAARPPPSDAAPRSTEEIQRAINHHHPTLEPLCYSYCSFWLSHPITSRSTPAISAGS